MLSLRLAVVAVAAMFLTASAFATNYAVGTCLPNLTSYATISQAVSSVPSGSTIEVCAGTYPEQVVITQPLTLEGVPGTTSDAVITVPAGGLTNYISTTAGSVTYQVLVQATGPVNLMNLAVDGTGATGSYYVGGVVYLDTSGTASYLSVRNQTEHGLGVGLMATTLSAATQTVTIANSVFRGFDGLGVYVISGEPYGGPLTAVVQANIIDGTAGSNSVGIDYVSAGGTILSNLIADSAYGILMFSSSPKVTSNTIWSNVYGAYIDSGSASFTNNQIDGGGQYGVYLQGSATDSIVENNTIGNASTAVYGCNGSFGPASGFTVTGNLITDTAVGLEMPSGNTTAPNNYYVTANTVHGCP